MPQSPFEKFFGGTPGGPAGGGDGGGGGPPPPAGEIVPPPGTGNLGSGIYQFGPGSWEFRDTQGVISNVPTTYQVQWTGNTFRITTYTGASVQPTDRFLDLFRETTGLQTPEVDGPGVDDPEISWSPGTFGIGDIVNRGENRQTAQQSPEDWFKEAASAIHDTLGVIVQPEVDATARAEKSLGAVLRKIPIVGPFQQEANQILRRELSPVRDTLKTKIENGEDIPDWIAEKLDGAVDKVYQFSTLEIIPIPGIISLVPIAGRATCILLGALWVYALLIWLMGFEPTENHPFTWNPFPPKKKKKEEEEEEKEEEESGQYEPIEPFVGPQRPSFPRPEPQDYTWPQVQIIPSIWPQGGSRPTPDEQLLEIRGQCVSFRFRPPGLRYRLCYRKTHWEYAISINDVTIKGDVN